MTSRWALVTRERTGTACSPGRDDRWRPSDVGWLLLLTVCAVTVATAILFAGVFAMNEIGKLYPPKAPAPAPTAPVVPIPDRTRVPDPNTPQTPVDLPGRSSWAPA